MEQDQVPCGKDHTCFEVIGEGEGGMLQTPTVSGKRHGWLKDKLLVYIFTLLSFSWKIQTVGDIVRFHLIPGGLYGCYNVCPSLGVRVFYCYSPLLGIQLGDSFPEGSWAFICGKMTPFAFFGAEKQDHPAMPELGIRKAALGACTKYIAYGTSGSDWIGPLKDSQLPG